MADAASKDAAWLLATTPDEQERAAPKASAAPSPPPPSTATAHGRSAHGLRKALAYGAGGVVVPLIADMTSSYLFLLLQYVVKLTPSTIGYILLGAKVGRRRGTWRRPSGVRRRPGGVQTESNRRLTPPSPPPADETPHTAPPFPYPLRPPGCDTAL